MLHCNAYKNVGLFLMNFISFEITYSGPFLCMYVCVSEFKQHFSGYSYFRHYIYLLNGILTFIYWPKYFKNLVKEKYMPSSKIRTCTSPLAGETIISESAMQDIYWLNKVESISYLPSFISKCEQGSLKRCLFFFF